MALERVSPGGDALAEELQLQEVILFSAFQEMVIQDTSVDSLLDNLFMQDHMTEASERPSTSADAGKSSSSIHMKESSERPSTSADAGKSSSSIPLPSDEFYCPICMESIPSSRKFGVSSCGHAFCVPCIGQYFAAKIGENAVHVKCPEPSCGDGTIELADCCGVIPSELFSRWDVALCELTLGEQRLYCPFRDCSAGLLAEDGNGNGAITEAECPHCHRLFCAQCMVPWHDGIGCREFQELGEDERGREDMMVRRLAGEQRWQRCPQCKMYVEKSEGCMFMKCRCGYCFCYSCASPMSKELHYCKICKR